MRWWDHDVPPRSPEPEWLERPPLVESDLTKSPRAVLSWSPAPGMAMLADSAEEPTVAEVPAPLSSGVARAPAVSPGRLNPGPHGPRRARAVAAGPVRTAGSSSGIRLWTATQRGSRGCRLATVNDPSACRRVRHKTAFSLSGRLYRGGPIAPTLHLPVCRELPGDSPVASPLTSATATR